MKCFSMFSKDKSKSKRRESRSAPELRNQSKPDNPLSRTTRSTPSPRSIPELYKEKEHNLRVFSLEELKDATNGFNRMLKIGEGGFGSVYKGSIRPLNGRGDPTVVAIKRLNTLGLQGHKEWLAEIQFLGVVSHPNLVKLLGLEDHLFNTTSTLPWRTRLEIMLGAAEGLAYLHDGLEVKVIYRDFKSSNVLLDENFRPKLSDFGLAREGPSGDRTHVSTAVVGTYGYAAPEYVETGHLTIQSDIWTFGVVLFEILTGRRAIERNRPTSEQKLLDWVKQFPPDSRRFTMIIDPRLRGNYSLGAAQKVGKLANSCLNKNAKKTNDESSGRELEASNKESDEASSSADKSAGTSSTRKGDRQKV
ncbi:putative receptor-like protein kinase [Hibiscus syriacus]|uniref:Receptor-like protein kinase n=1 Tax=Hibiscus syriacus TaxID=106335 RepID=A0A6A3CDF7_HIBSY|nr:putative receptor-like protein kinase [Hibiscus syriacus]